MSSARTIRDLVQAMRDVRLLEKMPVEQLYALATVGSGRKVLEQWQRAREGAF